jgi:hypothetical protein
MPEDNDDKKPPRMRVASNSTLPIASVIDDPETFRRAVALLAKGSAAVYAIRDAEKDKDEASSELATICEAYSLKGIRHGLNAFEYHGYTARQTLSRERLLALGVPAETIAKAMVEGKPFLSARLAPFDIE